MANHQNYFVLHTDPCVVYAKGPWHFPDAMRSPGPLGILAATNRPVTPALIDAAIEWGRSLPPQHQVEFLLPSGCDALRAAGFAATEHALTEDADLIFLAAVRRMFRAVGVEYDPAFDLFHLWRPGMQFWQEPELLLSGGNKNNRALLTVARQEEHVRRYGSTRFWEHPLP